MAARKPRRWLGTTVALAAVLALFALAWWLTHRPAQVVAGRPGMAVGAGSASGPGGRSPGASGGAPAMGGGPPGAEGGRAPPTTVGVATAVKADIPVWLDALGTVTPSATVTVRPQVSGVLQGVLYTEGQLVRAGQVLAQIDPRPFELVLMQATGQRLRDEAQLENARLTLQRYERLLAQDSIARQDVDTQAALVRQLEGTVVSDKAVEGTARLNVGYTRITAPIDGRVGLRVIDSGNFIASGDANGVAVITRLSPIDVEFAVPQDRVPEIQRRVAAGARLAVTAFDRTRTTELESGTFSTLDNRIDEQTGTVRAKARFGNARGTLFPSQFVNVRLLLDTVQEAVVVPASALRQGANGAFVFVLRDDRTVGVRQVRPGLPSGDRVAIASGLAAGERVVTEGADRLREGSRVVLPAARAGSAASAGGAGREGRGERGGGIEGNGGAGRSGSESRGASAPSAP